MRYKKHMIILLAAIFLFAMATASAADLNDTAVAVDDGQLTDEIIQASENQENMIQASNNDEVNLSEDDSGKLAIGNDKKLGKTVTEHTFKAIENAIESDCTIYLEPGTYTGDNEIFIGQKSNIKIIGDSTILDAQGKTRIFCILQSSNITIQNIIFKNGYTDRYGGAIEVIDNCRDCSISNCTFINNHAEMNGGAIDWFELCANGWVSNCTFINNTAKEDGGAISWSNSNDGRVNNCTFINNTAEGDGDAIYAMGYDLNADYNWFGNTADNYNDQLPINYEVKCDYRLFLNATANPDTITRKDTSNITFKLYQYHSGVISDYDNAPFKNLNLTITATKGNVKGTVKLDEPIQFTPTGKGTASVTATVENVRQTAEINVLKGDFDLLQDLVNNESLSIINLERNYTYNEFDTITEGVRINRPITINGNGFTIDAKGKSRIFYVTAGAINITDVTLKNGKADEGGAIYFVNAISNSNINATYINNTAEQNGGANWFFDSVLGSNVSGTFINNTAELYGGANYFWNSVSGSNVSGTYINNTAEWDGGANFFNRVLGSNVSGTYINNTAERDGGANYFWDSVLGSNVSGTFINNTAELYGGANYFQYSVSTSNISGIYISNTASNAVIHFEDDYNYGLDADITNAIFLNNNCTYEISARTQGIVVKDSWFGNNASNYMNKPNIINDEVQMDSWLFLNGTNDQNNIKFFLMGYDGTTVSEYDNTLMPKINLTIATTDGILDKSTVDLDEPVKFSPTKSGINRVTAQIEDATQTIEFTNGDFDVLQTIVNNATSSVINLTRNYTYNEFDTITDGVRINRPITINGNGFTIDAKGKSRIFYVTAGSINITDVTLKNGKADYGGAIIFENDISNSNINATYINNTAREGGANYFVYTVLGSNVSGTYINNTAEWYGGANNFYNVSTSNISGTYINNTAERNGGANDFFDSVSTSNISGTYINNTAEQNGGANRFGRVSGSNISGTYINNTASNAVIYFEDYFNYGLDANITNAIFLNNNCTYEIYASTRGIVVKDSWFGNNASNFMNKPNVNDKVTVDNWLFLNATADPSSLLILDSSNITFKLYSTDGTNVSDFDNSKLPAVNLTLTATNGDVDKTTTLDNMVKYVATEQGKCRVTAKIENATYTIYFNNLLRDVDLSASAQNITYPENEILTLTYNNTATGKVNITLKSKNYKKTIEGDINQTITIANLPAGEYDVTIEYLGDNVFSNATSSAYFTVEKITTEIIPDEKTIELFVEDKSNITYTLSPDYALGNVSFSSNDSNIVSVDSESGEIMANAEGSATITVSFSGSENYTASSTNVTVTVSKIPAEIVVQNDTVDLMVGEEFDPVVGLMPSGAGNLSFKSSNVDVVLVNGHGCVLAVGEGNATVTVAFDGNKKYAAASKNITVSVSKIPTEITLTNETLDLKVYDVFEGLANLTPADAGNLTFVSSDEDIVFVAENIILAFGKGNATVTVSFAGNDKYAAAENRTITVNVSLKDASVSVENSTLELYVDDEYDLNATTVPHWLNVEYASSDESVATVTDYGIVVAVGEGTATITVTVGDDLMFTVNSTKVTVTVKKQDANANVSIPENITVDENSTVNVVLPEDATGNVTVIVDGEVADTVAVTDGTAEVTIPSMSAGNHTVEIAYSGDGKYNSLNQTKEITVSKKDTTPEITIPSDIEVGDNATVDVKLPVDAGGNVTLKVDGETVDTVPVENGTASVKLPELNAGNHTVEIDYSGDDKYNSASKTATITVNKYSTNITAADVTATYKVNKYLVIKLTDSMGNPLANSTVTVELSAAKNYTSDENGQIKVKVSNLVPKTYTAKIAFKGDEKYAGSNTAAEVTVKKATAKITAKAKTFKTTTKTKKYTVMLKANGKALKNKWVYLKVNGKKYKAKTNSKGKATFKITQLNKAGKFKAAVTFKGNDYYKKATKKATIKVKSVWKTVQKGSKNSAIVKKIQRALKNHGYYLEYNGRYLMVDGIFWDYTEMAVKEFQNDKTLKVTGKVDEKTAIKLGII